MSKKKKGLTAKINTKTSNMLLLRTKDKIGTTFGEEKRNR